MKERDLIPTTGKALNLLLWLAWRQSLASLLVHKTVTSSTSPRVVGVHPQPLRNVNR